MPPSTAQEGARAETENASEERARSRPERAAGRVTHKFFVALAVLVEAGGVMSFTPGPSPLGAGKGKASENRGNGFVDTGATQNQLVRNGKETTV